MVLCERQNQRNWKRHFTETSQEKVDWFDESNVQICALVKEVRKLRDLP